MPDAKPSFPILRRGHPLAQGLVMAHAFYEGSGLTLNDLSGGGYTGTLTGSVWGGSPLGTAWSEDTDGDQIDLTANPYTFAANASFTYCWSGVWNGITSGNPGFWRTGSGASGFDFCIISGSTSTLWLRIGGSDIIRDVGTAVPNGSDSHLAFTWDDRTTSGATYVNGALSATGSVSIHIASTDQIITMGWQSGTTQRIGGKWAGQTLYNRALSAAEIAQLAEDPWQIYRRRSWRLKHAGAAPSVVFRKTLSGVGGRVGSRQIQGW